MATGTAQNCKEKGCMGKPKKTHKASIEGFEIVCCTSCLRTTSYEKVEVVNDKTLFTSEEELQKLINDADKKKPTTRKSEKKNENKQLGINF